MSFQKPRAVSACCWPFGNIPVSLTEQEFGSCSTDCRGHTWDGHLQDWPGSSTCQEAGMAFSLLRMDYCGQAQQGAPLEPALSSAQGADHGPHTEFWHQGWHPGFLYPWLLHSLSLSSLCAPLLCCHLGGSCPCCISSRSQQVEKGRRQGQGARGGSGTLTPSISGKVTLGPCTAMVLIPHRN